jgi:hypothetical protein
MFVCLFFWLSFCEFLGVLLVSFMYIYLFGFAIVIFKKICGKYVVLKDLSLLLKILAICFLNLHFKKNCHQNEKNW